MQTLETLFARICHLRLSTHMNKVLLVNPMLTGLSSDQVTKNRSESLASLKVRQLSLQPVRPVSPGLASVM